MGDIEYSPLQKQAIEAVLEWYREWLRGNAPQIFYLAGYAGTGKSTIAKEILAQLRKHYSLVKVVSGAYTGKAVDVLRKKGMFNPMTIHSMIYLPEEDPETKQTRWVKQPSSPASTAQLIVLDEASMVDKIMGEDLLSFKRPILVMGDPGQLPAINGQGFFNNRKPDFFLNEIHRQAADNPILKLATMARQGERIKPGTYGDSVIVTDQYNKETIRKYIFTKKRQPICGANKTRYSINRIYRKAMGVENNPLPVKGETLICLQNNRDLGLYNGMTGFAYRNTEYKTKENCLVYFQSDSETSPLKLYTYARQDPFKRNYDEGLREDPAYKKEILRFDYGYCLTCHKAQGSEWDHVTVIDESDIFREHKYKWLYTAITRASQSLVIIQK